MGPVTVHLEPETLRRARVDLDGSGRIADRATVSDVAEAAIEYGLTGFLRTGPNGTSVEIEGTAASITSFLQRIAASGLRWSSAGELEPVGGTEFAVLVLPAARRPSAPTSAPADVALCPACVEALFDRGHARFLDPTIGCANCRGDVREAARSALRLVDPANRDIEGNPLKSAMTILLLGGRILATRDGKRVRLYADATRPAAVAALLGAMRTTEGRLVALCPDLEWAHRLAVLDEAATVALASPANPAVSADPQPVGPALDLTSSDGKVAVTLPGDGMTHLMARAAARPLAYLDLPVGTGPEIAELAIGTLFAERAI